MVNLLITGGTGTLGNMIVDCILSNCYPMRNVSKVVVFSRDEQKQEAMAAKFARKDKDKKLRFLIGDIRDKERVKLALNDVDTIIHAAALKIVPTMEYNPMEAVKTNILGTQNLIEAILETDRNIGTHKVMVSVSTDKAVYPINLYGATKLAMEKLTISANNVKGKNGPKFGVVRYGNVSGSRGSVIPLFQKQIVENKGCVTITHKDMTRFWISPYDAAQFVMRSIDIMQTFDKYIQVPKMKAYKITTLARALGAKRFDVVGVRPGEKLHEDIITEREASEHYWLEKLPRSSDKAEMLSLQELRYMIKCCGEVI